MPASSYITNAPQTGTGCRASGAIQALTLPTLGRLEWTWQNYQFPSGSAKMPWRFSSGVATRGLRNPDGTLLGYWSYQTSLTPDAVNGEEKQLVNTVYDPLGNRTVHYFSVYSAEQPGGWSAYDYSLPFTRFVTDGTGRFLSSRVYDANGKHLRSSYVRYEGDQRWSAAEIQDKTNLNRREASRRTVYEDDAGTFADETLSDFDGLGHYRQRQTGGSFPGSNVRTRFTSYNPGRGTYNQAGFSMLPSTSPWVLNTFASDQESEGTNTIHRSYCWNAAGELLRQRTHQANGSGQGAGDLIVVHTYTAGNLTREAWYGGDTQPVGTASDLCDLALPATPAYQLDHTYASGVRATSAWSGTTFKALDLTIEANTGLPSASRDTAGLTTTYAYDSLGRLTTVDPSDDALTTYTYRRATSVSSLARVTVAQVTAPGAVALAESRIDFDAFGRPEREEKLLPDVNGTWAGRKTTYNALGWKTFVSEAATASTFGTAFELFDPFGRPGKITPADGNAHPVTLAYAGVRQVTRTAKVATSSTAETDASTIEVYDRHDRLYEVTEPNGVKTRYEYDAANRLAKVCQAVTPTGICGQTRLFNYDSRGFLTSEQHPEKGPAGNGTVSYSRFDARGHAERMIDGPNDLAFAYDKAERLTLVREAGTGFVDCVNNGGRRCLKTFTFAGSNGTNDFRKGKLQIAARYNHVGNPFNTTVEVRDTYVYGGEEGRVSQKDTQMFLNGTAKEGFRQTWDWNLLGDLEGQTWPDCFATCTPSTPRTVTYGYTKGWLTSVPGFANAISYHANGLVNQVTHANGVVFTQQNDSYGMARPAGLSASKGTTTLWPSESYTYDGSGNIESIGTTTYLYDSLSRIVDARLPGGAYQLYTYDNYGNLTSTNTGGSLQNTPASLTTNRLTGAVSYDAAGNLTGWNGNTSEYDKFNQLVRQKSGAEEWIYIYTADDERFWSYRVGGGGSLWTLRDLSGKAMREYQAHVSWSTFEDYIYRGDQVLAGFLSSGAQRHFDLDHLGTIRLVTNVAGNAAGTHRYYPYGKEQTALQEADRRKWAGHERDLGSLAGDGDDLDYMHARHYSPVTGRFVSFDPGRVIPTSPQSWNRYSYALSNPLRYIDRDGRESEEPDGLFGYLLGLTEGFFNKFFPPQRADPNDPNVQALEEIGANPNLLPQNQAALVQQGLNTGGGALLAGAMFVGIQAGELQFFAGTISGYRVGASAVVEKGVLNVNVFALRFVSEGRSLRGLLGAFEKEASRLGAKQLIVKGALADDIFLSPRARSLAKKLGYAFKVLSDGSVVVSKTL